MIERHLVVQRVLCIENLHEVRIVVEVEEK